MEATASNLSGSSVTTSLQIPDRTLVFAIHTRVRQAITGATSFSVGTSGETGKYGSGIGVGLDSTNIGLASPTPYYADTDVLITASGGNFTGGEVQLVMHCLKMRGPWNW